MNPASANACHAMAQGCVSVVIPTRNRPRMVCAAVRSAFAQTAPPLEVLVVVDGPEEPTHPGTVSALEAMAQPGLRVLALETSVGGAEARNLGVRAARGEWIAFLDDDDLWMETKLARQLEAAADVPSPLEPVIAARVLARAPGWEEIWPRRSYVSGEPMAEYLFCRKGWRYGDALLQTSTLLARRRLLLRVPFTPGLARHQDWDWLLRVSAEPGVSIHCVDGPPLVVFHVEGGRTSVSRQRDWRWSAAWARSHAGHFSRKAMRGFLATECAAQAQDAPLQERLGLLARIVRLGPVAVPDLARAAGFLLLPQAKRRYLRDLARAAGRHG